jgi:hypothetical protein
MDKRQVPRKDATSQPYQDCHFPTLRKLCCHLLVTAHQVVGFFISLAAVMYSTQSAGTSGKSMFSGTDKLETELPYRSVFFAFFGASFFLQCVR